MAVSALRALIVGCAAATVLAGCGSSPDDGGSAAALTAGSDTTAAPGAASTTPDEPDAVRLNISIDAGEVTPTNQRIDASVGQEIALTVDSDVADELHVHSVPEHSFEIEPGQAQLFTFTVDVPGQVDLELHESDRTVATFVVRP